MKNHHFQCFICFTFLHPEESLSLIPKVNLSLQNQINIQMNNINNANNIPSTIPDKNQRVHLVSSPAINDVVSNR